MTTCSCSNTWINQVQFESLKRKLEEVAMSNNDKTSDNILSQRSVEIFRLTRLIKDAPDVCKQKINRIRKLIKSEEYSISADQVAGSILKIHQDLAV